jgi:hypothetical protein
VRVEWHQAHTGKYAVRVSAEADGKAYEESKLAGVELAHDFDEARQSSASSALQPKDMDKTIAQRGIITSKLCCGICLPAKRLNFHSSSIAKPERKSVSVGGVGNMA